jgi:hypothetical protein
MTIHDPRSGWKRLEETLVAIKPGESVTAAVLAEESGLAREIVEQVLSVLTNAEMFERRDDGSFIRRGLFETTMFPDADGRALIVASAAKRAYGTAS